MKRELNQDLSGVEVYTQHVLYKQYWRICEVKFIARKVLI
jgi:hypothetical protein